MAKYKKRILLGIAAIVLIGAAVGIFGVLLPYMGARSVMPANGVFVITQQSDGRLLLTWPSAENADYYCLEFLRPSEDGDGEVLYRTYISDGTECYLPELPADQTLTMRVRSEVYYRIFGRERTRVSSNALEVTTNFEIPVISDLQWTADPDEDVVNAQFTLRDGDYCNYYLISENGDSKELGTLKAGSLTLHFGEDGDLPMPSYGENCVIRFTAVREIGGLKFYGGASGEMTVTRDDLLGRDLDLQWTDEGDNVISLRWDETKGEYYEVQMMDDELMQWVTLEEIDGDGERSYTSPHLEPFREYRYRVVALGGQTMEGSAYAAVSEEITFTTAESPVYATIWPVKELEVYSDAQMTSATGSVAAMTALCVLDEEDGMFAVRVDGQTGYIDSNYCMINLPDYLGELCSYEITNSVSSIYMVHEYEIPSVTGVVTAGYENVHLSDGSYLVPLLYPTAKKLVTAALAAKEQGYQLKIYDSFRPNKATREIYSLTEEILDNELPEKTYTGVDPSELDLPEPQVPESSASETTPDGGTATAEAIITYRMVMTGGKYGLNYFLARGRSMHNLGVALDLTLVNAETGEELQMQTSMHDLSYYSILSKNNTAANTLASIMKAAGFGDLVSEWWHFQDNEIRSTLSLPTVYDGVSVEGWKADDTGWRYRTASGTYYAGQTVTIDGTAYTFDAEGYVLEP